MFAKIANSNPIILKIVDGKVIEFSSQREVAKFLNISEWKVSISIKEHRFVNEGNGYLEANLK